MVVVQVQPLNLLYSIAATDDILTENQPKGFQPEVTRFYSRIADRSAISNTWHYLRGLDIKGSGWVKFSLSEAAAILRVSIATIRRHLREGVRGKKKFFNWFKASGDTATACYVSRDKVCRWLGLTEWGAVAEVFLHDLPASKELATELEAIARQKSSQYQAKKDSRRRITNVQNILKPSLYTQNVDLPTWGNSTGVNWVGSRFTFVEPTFVAYGASQAGIGKQMNRCDRTIKRRLSNSQRNKKGLENLDRKQIAMQVDEYSPSLGLYMQMYEKPGKLFRCGGKVFTAMCNVYNPQYDLITMRSAKKQFVQKTRFLKLAIALKLISPSPIDYLGSNKGQFCTQRLMLLSGGWSSDD